MEKYRQMLIQALSTDLSAHKIAQQRRMSHHTVARWRALAVEHGLTVDCIAEMGNKALSKLMRPAAARKAGHSHPNWAEEYVACVKLKSCKAAWRRYKTDVGEENALKYRAYCGYIRKYRKKSDPVLNIDHQPGYAMQIDYGGDKQYAICKTTRKTISWCLFVAVLPASGLIFASLLNSQSGVDHSKGNVDALDYFGGSPKITVPDNLKAAVISRPRYGPPVINRVFQQFADHYKMAVLPARPNEPRDKGAVENAVKIVQMRLAEERVDRPVPTFEQLRKILSEIVEDINNTPMRCGQSRREIFNEHEKPSLRPLPEDRFEYFEMSKSRIVPRNYHVTWDGAEYSVPHQFINDECDIRSSATVVQIFVDGLMVATHPRASQPKGRVTNPSHRPPNHQAFLNDDLASWAARFGHSVQMIAANDLERPQKPQARKQRSRWIMDLQKIHGPERFVQACDRAVALGDPRFEHVENVLQRGLEGSRSAGSVKGATTPTRNIRGSDYYAGDEQ